MNDRILLATFAHEDDLLAATAAVRAAGHRIVDVFTPYAVHGLDRAMGLRPSRLTWVCFVCGMVGAVGMLVFQHWTAAISWPLNVGGKPWNSLPAHVPVAFEAAVLLAGFGSVFALLWVSRLFPGRQARLVAPRVTDDRFVLAVDASGPGIDRATLERVVGQFDSLAIEEQTPRTGGKASC